MMAESLVPGEVPVSLNEARNWLRLGATIDDAVVAQLVRAATNICEAFIGRWLIVRAGEESLPLCAGAVELGARPMVAVDQVALVAADGTATALEPDAWRAVIARDGTARLTIHAPGDATRVRVGYRAGMADTPNGIPEAIRQGVVRMTQYLHDARDGSGAAPPAAIAALWQPWRRLTLGAGR